MNFLGHLYFSNNNHALMHANLFGDFVKGSDLSKYPADIQKGIILHRKIDDYIDQHPTINKLKHKLSKQLPKINSIAIDLYFDYLLAIHWSKYHSSPLSEFINQFENSPLDKYYNKHPYFKLTINKMKENKWLHFSDSIYGLTKSCVGVSKKISFENNLSQAPIIFFEHRESVQNYFFEFMTKAIPFFDNYHLNFKN